MTLTASRIEITPTDAALGAVITGVDVISCSLNHLRLSPDLNPPMKTS
jgi:hypothetical protein